MDLRFLKYTWRLILMCVSVILILLGATIGLGYKAYNVSSEEWKEDWTIGSAVAGLCAVIVLWGFLWELGILHKAGDWKTAVYKGWTVVK
jgi:hypothetical protein